MSEDEADGPAAPDPADVERAVEALLFAAAGPLSLADLARRLPEGADAFISCVVYVEGAFGVGVAWSAA